MPMIELTAWPPSVGNPSTRMTLRPARAASIAAEIPDAPEPTTHKSQPRSSIGGCSARDTMRVSGSNGLFSISLPQNGMATPPGPGNACPAPEVQGGRARLGLRSELALNSHAVLAWRRRVALLATEERDQAQLTVKVLFVGQIAPPKRRLPLLVR